MIVCPGVAQAYSKVVVDGCGLQQMGIYIFVWGLHPYWFQRHLNSKIFERDFRLPTIMGVQSNINFSSCLVVVVFITLFQLLLVHFESSRILVQPKYLNIFFTAMKIHIMARIGKEIKQLYFQVTSNINFLDVFHLHCRMWIIVDYIPLCNLY